MTEGIGYANFTCDRCDIHGWGKGAMMDANVTISNSWIHDMPVASGSHNEAILSLGGPNYTIVNNRLDSGGAGNFYGIARVPQPVELVHQHPGEGQPVQRWRLLRLRRRRKLLTTLAPPSNARFMDNTFGNGYRIRSAAITARPLRGMAAIGNVWSGNAMIDGTAVRHALGGLTSRQIGRRHRDSQGEPVGRAQ